MDGTIGYVLSLEMVYRLTEAFLTYPPPEDEKMRGSIERLKPVFQKAFNWMCLSRKLKVHEELKRISALRTLALQVNGIFRAHGLNFKNCPRSMTHLLEACTRLSEATEDPAERAQRLRRKQLPKDIGG